MIFCNGSTSWVAFPLPLNGYFLPNNYCCSSLAINHLFPSLYLCPEVEIMSWHLVCTETCKSGDNSSLCVLYEVHEISYSIVELPQTVEAPKKYKSLETWTHLCWQLHQSDPLHECYLSYFDQMIIFPKEKSYTSQDHSQLLQKRDPRRVLCHWSWSCL